jgi:CRP/FNR family transcriptional regulator, cyclic AMP receptor protein
MVHPALVTTLLARTDLFGSLGEPERMAIAREMREANYAAGQLIFAKNDPADAIYLVVEGRIRLSVLSVDGRVLSFDHASTGSIFGEIAALDGGVRTADATALTRVCAMSLARSSCMRLIESNPLVAKAAITFVCARLRKTSEQVEAIALHAIEVRLARFLLSCITVSKSLRDTTGHVRLDVGMSQSELALLLGASRQNVNAALSALEETGAVQRIEGRQFACEVAKLEHIAQAEKPNDR